MEYGEIMNLNRPPLPEKQERDWPSWDKVCRNYPQLCDEERIWILDEQLHLAREAKDGGAEEL